MGVSSDNEHYWNTAVIFWYCSIFVVQYLGPKLDFFHLKRWKVNLEDCLGTNRIENQTGWKMISIRFIFIYPIYSIIYLFILHEKDDKSLKWVKYDEIRKII